MSRNEPPGMRKRPCPFRGCKEKIASWALACKEHWMSLSEAQRDEVNNATTDRHNGLCTEEEMRRRHQLVLDAALQEAAP